jgi:HNH endonuclease
MSYYNTRTTRAIPRDFQIMNILDFCTVHRSKAGKDKVICYQIFNIPLLQSYFEDCNYKPVILALKLGIHYQSLRKLLQDANLWKYVRTKNGKGAGINRSRMRVTNKGGYPYSQNPDSYTVKNGRSRRKLAHIETMEQYLGRTLTELEYVHHINGDKLDSRIENLVIVSRSEHGKVHADLERVAMELVKKGVILFDKSSKTYIISEALEW